ncbi:hypothetical protein [Thalassospira tepidiphila]|uniref:Restriction endonuclease n=2 Tax=Thalassospira tepidiphila TaxID=393657 RepID=A0A853KZJ5_9PROT|nr:hypothetical protein [Thalassospira tepidiphila]NJB75343.1 hypothetical protein [Thalassospira tepidiphila]OAZ09345.1 hypothetical protein TH4_12850 [Thalassospira tepidiphila MCCC 1A03514]
MLTRQEVNLDALRKDADLPYSLRLVDFQMAMQDVYDFFYDVNKLLLAKGLHRMDDMLRPAAMSGMISDMLTASMAKHARTLAENKHFNGHPDLIVQGKYPNNSIASGEHGIEIKSTRKPGGGVDTHGAREQWMCVFVYQTDHATEPAIHRAPMKFTEVYLGHVTLTDFRKNARGELGTRTATLDRNGLKKLRSNWVYLDR